MNDRTPSAAPQPDEPAGPVTTAQFLEIFSAVMMPMFLAVADQTLLATATPSIAAELGGLRDTTWVALAYMIAVTVTAPLYGRLGDRLGRRDMLLAATGVFALGSLSCALAPNLGLLIAARFLQGMGGGGLILLSQALVGELVSPRERARFQGYFATNFSLASIGGPIIGGLIVHHASWRWLFYVNVPLCLVAAWRLRRLSQHVDPSVGPLEDLAGIALFATATALTLIWVSFAGHRIAWFSAPSAGMAVVALALWITLFRHEAAHAAPFLPVELLRDTAIARMALTVVALGACMFSLVFFLPVYFQLAAGINALDSGLRLLPLILGMVTGSTSAGRLIARLGTPAGIPAIGLALSGSMLALLALVPLHHNGISLLSFFCGMGLGTVMPTAQVVVQTLAGRSRLGAATALVSLSRATGSTLGTAGFGAVLFAFFPDVDLRAGISALGADASRHAEAISAAFRTAFGCAAGVAFCAAAVVARMRRVEL